MEFSKKQLTLYSAQQENILLLTSACNVSCIFCSHPQNPDNVQTYSIGHFPLAEILVNLDFIDPQQKIVIGESVTRIMEGEPFLHPEIQKILSLIRTKFPETVIQITTNGILLTDEILDLLESLKKIELYISLNSITPKGRELLMGSSGDQIIKVIPKLKKRGIIFHGSIVAMPWLVGWADLTKTVDFLDQYGAETIRIFLPGYTKKAKKEIHFSTELPVKLRDWVDQSRKLYKTPIMMEPPLLTDLKVEVAGVIVDSPADQAGFQVGDEIIKIGDKRPYSRVDAYFTLIRAGNRSILIKRGKDELILKLQKSPKSRSGLVFAYDLDKSLTEQLKRIILTRKARRVLMMVSTLAAPLLTIVADQLNGEIVDLDLKTTIVPNHFFAGSIKAAGLLVIQDFVDQWNKLADHNYDLVILPGIFLDTLGQDLVGRGIDELENKIKKEIVIF